MLVSKYAFIKISQQIVREQPLSSVHWVCKDVQHIVQHMKGNRT